MFPRKVTPNPQPQIQNTHENYPKKTRVRTHDAVADTRADRRLQIRVETFNLFNRANFTNPNGQFGGSAFGVISSAGPARNVQLAAKFLF